MITCHVCSKPFSQNPITGEATCFVHGNPAGSHFERLIYADWLSRDHERGHPICGEECPDCVNEALAREKAQAIQNAEQLARDE